MKKIIYSFVILSTMIGTIFISCRSSVEKVENAQENLQKANDKVTDANIELNKAINDSIMQFKKESERKFLAQEKSIAEFKVRIAKDKKMNKNLYEKKLADLDELKKSILQKAFNGELT